MAVTLGLTAATVAATGTVAAAEHGDNSVVRTDKGAVRGTTTGPVRAFRGIPYAAAPTGDQRWTPPAPAARWSGVRDATRPGSACPQTGSVRPAGPTHPTRTASI
nr:carboxylesterase family protein [Streptomyces rubrogriseus]